MGTNAALRALPFSGAASLATASFLWRPNRECQVFRFLLEISCGMLRRSRRRLPSAEPSPILFPQELRQLYGDQVRAI